MIPLIDWSVLPVGAYLTGLCRLKVVHLRLDGLNWTHCPCMVVGRLVDLKQPQLGRPVSAPYGRSSSTVLAWDCSPGGFRISKITQDLCSNPM